MSDFQHDNFYMLRAQPECKKDFRTTLVQYTAHRLTVKLFYNNGFVIDRE